MILKEDHDDQDIKEEIQNKNSKRKCLRMSQMGKRPYGELGKRWLEDAENHLNKMGVRGWRNIARNRDGRKLILKGAKVLPAPYRQCRERERSCGQKQSCSSKGVSFIFVCSILPC